MPDCLNDCMKGILGASGPHTDHRPVQSMVGAWAALVCAHGAYNARPAIAAGGIGGRSVAMQQAAMQGRLVGIPFATPENIYKYFPDSDETAKGHTEQ